MKQFHLCAFADEAGSDLDTQIDALVRNGIPYLEIRNVDGVNVSDLSNRQVVEIRKRLDESGLSVWSLGSPYGKIGIEADFTPHLEKFKRGLEIAEGLGCKHIRLFSFFLPENRPAEQYREAVIARLSAFVKVAEGSGIVLCHENEKAIYGDIATRCAEIHQAIPGIKAVFDPANFVQCGQDTLEAWNLLAPYVEYLHIKDARRDGLVVPAGLGEGHIPALLQVYTGDILTLEPHLMVFDGLAALESGGHVSGIDTLKYKTADEAFDAGAEALRKIMG